LPIRRIMISRVINIIAVRIKTRAI